MWDNKRKHSEMRAPERTTTTNTKKTTNRYPLKLDFDAPANTGARFQLFDLCYRKSSNGSPKPLDMETWRVL